MGVMLGCSAIASDQSEIADMQARVATLEAQLATSINNEGSAESLMSLRKKGTIKIGGKVEIGFVVSRRNEANDADDQITRSYYDSADADLNIRVDAGADTYLFMKLDLDDTGSDGDLIEEVNFVWENVRGSNWTMLFGKHEIAYGQLKNNLCSTGACVDDGGPYVIGGGEPIADSSNPTDKTATKFSDSEEGFHESQSIMASWTGDVKNRWGVTASYKYKELATFEITAFQDSTGMHEDRSEDTGIQSWATRLTFKPNSRLTLTGSFINQHQDSMDENEEHIADGGNTTDGTAALGRIDGLGELADTRLRAIATKNGADIATFNAVGPAVDDDQMAVAMAFDYVTSNEKWDIYGEWSYTWHAAHFVELRAHVVSLGMTYELTPKIELVAQGDAVFMDNGVFKSLGIDLEENIYHAGAGINYTCDNGIGFSLEYSHEWYRNNLSNWDNGQGDLFGFLTSYSF